MYMECDIHGHAMYIEHPTASLFQYYARVNMEQVKSCRVEHAARWVEHAAGWVEHAAGWVVHAAEWAEQPGRGGGGGGGGGGGAEHAF